MNRLLLAVLAVAMLAFTLGTAMHPAGPGDNSAIQANSAPYRDGFYLGKMDAGQNKEPHITSGRWSASEDRAMFIAGYDQGYQSLRADDGLAADSEAAGFQEGLQDGMQQQSSAGRYQPAKGDHYLSAIASSAEAEKFQHAYHRSYLNGYQRGYYLKSTSAQ